MGIAQHPGCTSLMMPHLSKIVTPRDLLSATPEIHRNSIKSIYAGFTNTMILMLNGTVYASGDNQYGQLGLDGSIRFKFAQVAISNVVGIALGKGWTIFHTLDGLFLCGDERLCTSFPKTRHFYQLPFDLKVAAVKAGAHHLVVLTQHGDLYAAGDNLHARQEKVPYASRLEKVYLPNVVHFQCGLKYTFAITAEEKFYFWGDTAVVTPEFRSSLPAVPRELPYYDDLVRDFRNLQIRRQRGEEEQEAKPVTSWGTEFMASDIAWF